MERHAFVGATKGNPSLLDRHFLLKPPYFHSGDRSTLIESSPRFERARVDLCFAFGRQLFRTENPLGSPQLGSEFA